jgi:DNA-binding PadR family transcriptional regulator
MPETLEYALLGFLRQQPMHGYEIHQHLSDSHGLGLVWHIKQSQLYALLSKLEQQNYISVTLEPQDSRPTRKVFHLTALGQTVFLEWVQSPVPHGRKLRLDFLAKLYFAQRETPPLTQQLLTQQRHACQQWLITEQARAQALAPQQQFEQFVHQFRLGQLEAMLTWLAHCQETLHP